ncbi:MAG: SusC/RagA family TonB-linked outer membrane protein [Flavicella sp.]
MYQSIGRCYALMLVLFLICTSQQVWAQKTLVTGTVLSEAGDPLPGVTVLSKGGKAIGTSTDFDGNFELKIAKNVVSLEFSYMGFDTQEVAVNGKTTFSITMKETSNELEEVVVVGFGTQKRKDITGAIASVKAAELERTVNMNMGDALQGKVAGLQVLSEDGTPGGGFKVNIRGASSITGSTEPLYVVDGFPIEVFGDSDTDSGYEGGGSSSPIDFLDASIIESIEILKDASATAIYGARGANGVVIITTKKGKAGDVKISYTISSSMTTVPTDRLPKMLNTSEYFDYIVGKEYYDPSNRTRIGDTEEWEFINDDITLYSIKDPYYAGDDEEGGFLSKDEWNAQMSDTNWLDAVMRTGLVTNHLLNLSGGTEKNTYNYSLSYLDNEGIVVGSGYDRIILNINLKNKFTEKLNLNTNISPTYSKSYGTGGGGSTTRNSWGFFSRVLNTPSYLRIGDKSDGNDDLDDDSLDTFFRDPVYQAENEINNRTKYGIRFITKASYDIFKGLRATVDFGMKFDRQEQRLFNPPTFGIGERPAVAGRATRNDRSQFSYTNSNVLNYATVLGKHKINATLGVTQQSRKTNNFMQRANSFDISEPDGSINFDKALDYDVPRVRNEQINQLGFLSRLNYVFNKRYSFTATLRRDGDSRFNKKNRFRNFPSMAFAWTVSKEPFMENVSFVENWKIRLSAGKAGNSGVRPRDSREAFTDYLYNFGGNYAIGSGSRLLVDENLTWQSTSQYDLGMDISLFNGRLKLVTDAYLKQTRDMILDQGLAPNTGFTLLRTNAGDMDNWGFELSINSENIVKKNFVWSTTLTFAADRSQVLDLAGPQQQFFKDRLTGGNSAVLQVGQNVGTWMGYKMDGVYNSWAEIEATQQLSVEKALQALPADATPEQILEAENNYVKTNLRGDTLQPGDPKYVDVNGDGRVNEFDLTIIADTQPDFHGGLYNNFKIKNFDFNFFLTYKYNMDVINGDKLKHTYHSRGGGNTMFASALYNVWTPDNPTSEHPGYHADEGSQPLPLSSYHVEDGSFIRLQNISLSYNIPKKILTDTFISSCKLSFSVNNAYLWTNYSGSDPENSVSRGQFSNLSPNLDWGTYPRARTWNTSLKIGF